MKKTIFTYLLINTIVLLCYESVLAQLDTIYHKNGKIRGIGLVENGNKIGNWVFYNESGLITQTIVYSKKKASVKSYSCNNSIEYIYISERVLIGDIFDNDSCFLWSQYNFKKNRISDSSYFINGEVIHYYSNGQIGEKFFVKRDQINGKYCTYYLTGEKGNTFYYRDDIITGKWITYFKNGTIMVKGKYKNGGRHGLWLEYYANGNIKERGYYCEDINSVYITFDNIKEIQQLYPELIPHIYYANYYLDFKSGKWEYFDEEGNLNKEEFYEKGKLVETKIIDEN